jgi:cysteinyl-tRNA synthetase
LKGPDLVLKLYNTLTRQKAEFAPIDPKNVRMYVCGPTVYDFAHIGNARPVIVFDVLYRLLRHVYGAEHVTYVRNITDVDDKINARALRDFPELPLNDAIARVTEKTANQFHADVKALGCLEPSVEPRATDNIAQMIAIIEQLIAKAHAYRAAGEVLFDVTSMKDYGALSNRNLDEQQAGARVDVEAHKKNPGDFVLWKSSSAEEPGWDSPWGRGRPGWHIECSAMSARYLGQVFDIHGGGLDLIFPHHENEIAQSRCAHGTSVMANVWMHNGFLQVEGEKMSKSLGNFKTIKDELDSWGGSVLKFNMLKTHYRQPIDWTLASLKESGRELDRWREAVHQSDSEGSEGLGEMVDALADDLNTHAAITRLREFYKDKDFSNLKSATAFLGLALDMDSIQGRKHRRIYVDAGSYGDTAHLDATNEDDKLNATATVSWPAIKITPDKIGDLIAARLAARKAKDFKESDRIRDELAKMGIALKDSKDPATGEIVTTWEVAR